MTEKLKKPLLILLAMIMLLTSIPLQAFATEDGSGTGADVGSQGSGNKKYAWTINTTQIGYRLSLYWIPKENGKVNWLRAERIGKPVVAIPKGGTLSYINDAGTKSTGLSVWDYMVKPNPYKTRNDELNGLFPKYKVIDGDMRTKFNLKEFKSTEKVATDEKLLSIIPQNPDAWNDEYIMKVFGKESNYDGLVRLSKEAGQPITAEAIGAGIHPRSITEESLGTYKLYIEALVGVQSGSVISRQPNTTSSTEKLTKFKEGDKLILSLRDLIFLSYYLHDNYQDMQYNTVPGPLAIAVQRTANSIFLTKDQAEIQMKKNNGYKVPVTADNAEKQKMKDQMQVGKPIFDSMGVGVYVLEPQEEIKKPEGTPHQFDGLYLDKKLTSKSKNPCDGKWDPKEQKWHICDVDPSYKYVSYCVTDSKDPLPKFPEDLDTKHPECKTVPSTDRPPVPLKPNENIIVKWKKEKEPEPEKAKKKYKFTIPQWRLNRYVKDMDKENEEPGAKKTYQCVDIRADITSPNKDLLEKEDYNEYLFVKPKDEADYNKWKLPESPCEQIKFIYNTINPKDKGQMAIENIDNDAVKNMIQLDKDQGYFTSRHLSKDNHAKQMKVKEESKLASNKIASVAYLVPGGYSDAEMPKDNYKDYITSQKIIYYLTQQGNEVLDLVINCKSGTKVPNRDKVDTKGEVQETDLSKEKPHCLPVVSDAHLQKGTEKTKIKQGYRLVCWVDGAGKSQYKLEQTTKQEKTFETYNLKFTTNSGNLNSLKSLQGKDITAKEEGLIYKSKLAEGLEYVHVYGDAPRYKVLTDKAYSLGKLTVVDADGNINSYSNYKVYPMGYTDENKKEDKDIVTSKPEKDIKALIETEETPQGKISVLYESKAGIKTIDDKKVLTTHVKTGDTMEVDKKAKRPSDGEYALGKYEILKAGKNNPESKAYKSTEIKENEKGIDIQGVEKEVETNALKYTSKQDGALFKLPADKNGVLVKNNPIYLQAQAPDKSQYSLTVIPEVAMMFDPFYPTRVGKKDIAAGQSSVKVVAGENERKINPIAFHTIDTSIKIADQKVTATSAIDSRMKTTGNWTRPLPVVYKGAPLQLAYKLTSKGDNGLPGPSKNAPVIKMKSYVLDANASDFGCIIPKNVFGNAGAKTRTVHENFIKNFSKGGNVRAIDLEATSHIELQGKDGTKKPQWQPARPEYIGPNKVKAGVQGKQLQNEGLVRKYALTVRGGVLVSAKQVGQMKGQVDGSQIKTNTPMSNLLLGQVLPGGTYGTMGLPGDVSQKPKSLLSNFERQQGSPLQEESFRQLAAEVRLGYDKDLERGQGWYNEDTITLVVYEYIDFYTLPADLGAFTDKVPNSVATGANHYLETPVDKTTFFSEVGRGKGKFTLNIVAKNTVLNTYTNQGNNTTDKYPLGVDESAIQNKYYFGTPNVSIQDTMSRN
jgi:hypothetical protein